MVVHSAAIQDRVGARSLLLRLATQGQGLRKVFADGAYTGTLIAWCRAMFGWSMEVVKLPAQRRFLVLPKRWIVERTFAWLGGFRRLAKDYEINPRQSEAMIKLAMIHLLLRRLT